MVALRNLWRRKLRTIMTIIGTAGAVSLYVSVHAITGSIHSQIEDVTAGYGGHITIQERGASPLNSAITPADLAQVTSLASQARISVTVAGSRQEEWAPFLLVFGSTAQRAQEYRVVEGRVFQSGHREVLVGQVAANRLSLQLGDSLSIGNESFSVVGFYSVGSRYFDGAVLLELQDAQRVLDRGDTVSALTVYMRSEAEADRLIPQINRSLPRLRAVRTEDFIGTVNQLAVARAFAYSIGMMALLVSCVVVTNTLLMSTVERTREIGILMAIGWRLTLIWRMLLAEALALCVAGIVLGNVCALLMLRAMNHTRAIGFGWIPVAIPPLLALESLGLAVVMALVSSMYPTIVAARLSPVEAIRFE